MEPSLQPWKSALLFKLASSKNCFPSILWIFSLDFTSTKEFTLLMKTIGNWGKSFHDMHTWWGLGSHFNRHRPYTRIFWSNIFYITKMAAADFCGSGYLQYSLSDHPSSSLLMNEVVNSLPLIPESNAVWSQRFGSFSLPRECWTQAICTWWPSTVQENVSWLGWYPPVQFT